MDSDYFDLIALSEGYTDDDIKAFGGIYLLPMNEIISVDAQQKYKNNAYIKEAKQLFKQGRKAAKKDPDTARKCYQKAIKLCEKGRDDLRKEIKDDTALDWATKNVYDGYRQSKSGEKHQNSKEAAKSNSRDQVILDVNTLIKAIKMQMALL